MRAKEFLKKNKHRKLGGFDVVVLDVDESSGKLDEVIHLNAPHKVIPNAELHQKLDRIKTKTTTTQDRLGPIIHQKNIKFIKSDDPEDLWDLDELRDQITTRPLSGLLSENAKMKKTRTGDEILYDVTLPALAGIVVDEDTNEFVQINTCPAAGECKINCYARKGGYVQFSNSSLNSSRILNFLVNDPEGWFDVVDSEIRIRNRLRPKGSQLIVRWHDAGDFFSKEYFELALDVVRKNPTVIFYAYTKVSWVATSELPDNFLINYSYGAHQRHQQQIEKEIQGGKVIKRAFVVPYAIFKPFVERKKEDNAYIYKPGGLQQFKQKLADEYNVDANTVITYKEMLNIPRGNVPKWNVIVNTGDGDQAAFRKDVINSYQMVH